MSLANIQYKCAYLATKGHSIVVPRSPFHLEKMRLSIVRNKFQNGRDVRIASQIMRESYGPDRYRTASTEDLKRAVVTAVVQDEVKKLPPLSGEAVKGFSVIHKQMGIKNTLDYVSAAQKLAKSTEKTPFDKLLDNRLSGLSFAQYSEVVGKIGANQKDPDKIAQLLGVDPKVVYILIADPKKFKSASLRKTATPPISTMILDGVGWVWTNIIEWIGPAAWGLIKTILGSDAMTWVGGVITGWIGKLLPNVPSVVESAFDALWTAVNGVGSAIAWTLTPALHGVYSAFKFLCRQIYENVPHSVIVIGLGAVLVVWLLVTQVYQMGGKFLAIPPKVLILMPIQGVWWVLKQIMNGVLKSSVVRQLMHTLGFSSKDEIDELAELSNQHSKYTKETEKELEEITNP